MLRVAEEGRTVDGVQIIEDGFAVTLTTESWNAIIDGIRKHEAFFCVPARFDPDCEFRVVVDVNNVVGESDEGNNFASGVCLG